MEFKLQNKFYQIKPLFAAGYELKNLNTLPALEKYFQDSNKYHYSDVDYAKRHDFISSPRREFNPENKEVLTYINSFSQYSSSVEVWFGESKFILLQ